MRVVTRALRVSTKLATGLGFGRGTVSAGAIVVGDPSVRSSVKSRSTLDERPRSSTALTTNAHVPSCSGDPSARRAFQWNGYVPGPTWVCVFTRRTPSGPRSWTVTVDGRTTLYVKDSLSFTPSPFGDTAGADGSDA